MDISKIFHNIVFTERPKLKIGDFLKRWLLLIILAVFIFAAIEYMHSCITGYAGLDDIKSHIFMEVIDVCVLVTLFCFLPFRNGKFLFILLLPFLIFIIGNILYAKYNEGYMPVKAWTAYENLSGLGPTIIYGMGWSNWLLLISAVVLCVFGFFYKPYPGYRERMIISTSFMAIIVSFGIILSKVSGTSLYKWPDEEVAEKVYVFDRQLYTFYRGLSCTTVMELKNLNKPEYNYTAEDIALINSTIDHEPFTNHFDRPKRIIFIIIESLISDPIGKRIDGVEVTPNLNRLKSEGLYCANVHQNIKKGQSSDGQFVYFTGLLPESNGITVMDVENKSFDGLGSLASKVGYKTILINPCNHTYWRQDEMCEKYGIDVQFSIDDFTAKMGRDTGAKHWLDDKDLCDYAGVVCDEYSNDSTLTVILTSTMHLPYDHPFYDKREEFANVSNRQYACYLQKLNYTDYYLGMMIGEMEEKGMLDDTVLVIAADHSTPTVFDFGETRPIPFIIWGRNIAHEEFSGDIQQIDLYPTILNLMGYDSLPYMGLGRSIFDGGSGDMDLDSLQSISDLIIVGNWFGKASKSQL